MGGDGVAGNGLVLGERLPHALGVLAGDHPIRIPGGLLVGHGNKVNVVHANVRNRLTQAGQGPEVADALGRGERAQGLPGEGVQVVGVGQQVLGLCRPEHGAHEVLLAGDA